MDKNKTIIYHEVLLPLFIYKLCDTSEFFITEIRSSELDWLNNADTLSRRWGFTLPLSKAHTHCPSQEYDEKRR